MTSKRDVLPMEVMGYDFGYIIYRTTFMRGKEMNFIGALHDYGLVIINNKTLQKVDNIVAILSKPVRLDKVTLEKSNILDIFIENCGRVYAPSRLNDQRKGLRGRVLINNVQLIGYKIGNLNFNEVGFFCVVFII
ncbi:unnamed protein product [Dimorphilus gyrociliatus]|uniref:Beta-galactosidase 1-like first all-beta domain-containing protein n=1 Tax=Dimorphilus gyrociliatus TaxID=2664684 RepID=A0A7I8WEG4_9ANNE|nr:unnamed protein product [Dimorphilus gyrociliatus]